MSKPLKYMKPENLHQLTVDRLHRVYRLAKALGYSEENAKALAVGALERKNQGGWTDYMRKVVCIKLATACLGKHLGLTYDRIMEVREPRPFAKAMDEDGGWSGKTELEGTDPQTQVKPNDFLYREYGF